MLRNAPPADLAAEHARLIASLKQADVPVIGFVNEGLLYSDNTLRPERVQMLRDWLDAGFELGNHTRWHSDLNAVGVRRFKTDILEGERLLRPMLAKRGAKPQWFRYPLLRTGTTLQDKAAVETFLGKHGYRIAPVTINSSEWVFALAYRQRPGCKGIGRNAAALARRLRRLHAGQARLLRTTLHRAARL
jgi:peptidoglycan/xylan/chitin deacetylase (PgdA/CDA1 family)